MTPLFKKLNYKGQGELYVLNAPESMATEIREMKKSYPVISELDNYKNSTFVMVFVTTQKQLNDFAPVITKNLSEDGAMYFCYPKATSKKYSCDFNRDTGWQVLGGLGFEPVRQVAIDEDWSALRFRKPTYIKKMTRHFAMTEEGKRKVKTNRG
jgi:hypothetical protein